MLICNKEWNFIRLDDEISLVLIDEITSGVKGILKTKEDRICDFHIKADQVPKVLLEGPVHAEGMSNFVRLLLFEFDKVEYKIKDPSSLFIYIESKKGSPVFVRANINEIPMKKAYSYLASCSNFLMKNYLSLFQFKKCLAHLTAEKDRAIEFLGNTAKDYGASTTLAKWAPENSHNYKILLKFKEDIFQDECIVNNILNPDFSLDEINQSLKRFSNITILKPTSKESSDKTTQNSKSWASEFGDEDDDQDSFLAKFNLGDEINLKLSQDTEKEGSSMYSSDSKENDESATDIEFESPQKRIRKR